MGKMMISLILTPALFPVVAAVFLGFVPPVRVSAMGVLYSDEVSTFRSIGGGYAVDGSVFFLMNYGLYRAPRGIARFPDGGTSRYITREVFLCRADGDSSVNNLMSVMSGHNPGLDVRSSYFETQDDLLMVLFRTSHGARNDPQGWTAVGWNIRTNTPVPLTTTQKGELLERLTLSQTGRVSIKETTALLERATLKELQLPSPLDHMRRTERQYLCDLVALRGDEYYRRAIIESVADGTIPADPGEILRRMEDKRLSLEEPYRSLYQMRAVEVIRSLEALAE
jgi:hypothetical protein